MTLTINDADEATLRELAAVGQYGSLEAALSAAIWQAPRMIEGWRRFDPHLDEALDDVAAGRVYTSGEVRADLDALIASKVRKAA